MTEQQSEEQATRAWEGAVIGDDDDYPTRARATVVCPGCGEFMTLVEASPGEIDVETAECDCVLDADAWEALTEQAIAAMGDDFVGYNPMREHPWPC